MRSQRYDWMRTKALYEAALREDPQFAESWSGLADVWMERALQGPLSERSSAAIEAARCARRALALQPRNVEALSAIGLLASQRDYDLAAAEDAFRQAVIADPEYVDARVNLAMILGMRGQADESLREFAIARQLDPANLDLSGFEPILYLCARRYEDALACYRDILAVHPDSKGAAWGVMSMYIAQKNWDEALAMTKGLGDPQTAPQAGTPVTEAEFLKVYRGLKGFVETGRRRGLFSDYTVAHYYAQLGDRDRAFSYLERAIDERVPSVSYIMVDPRVDSLRSDSRFNALVARTKLGQPPATR
jgi:tetratricopeptide (TPR) repeat protein